MRHLAFYNDELFLEFEPCPDKKRPLLPTPSYLWSGTRKVWALYKGGNVYQIEPEAVPEKTRALALLLIN